MTRLFADLLIVAAAGRLASPGFAIPVPAFQRHRGGHDHHGRITRNAELRRVPQWRFPVTNPQPLIRSLSAVLPTSRHAQRRVIINRGGARNR
jgi:hypothetical protein